MRPRLDGSPAAIATRNGLQRLAAAAALEAADGLVGELASRSRAARGRRARARAGVVVGRLAAALEQRDRPLELLAAASGASQRGLDQLAGRRPSRPVRARIRSEPQPLSSRLSSA